MTMKLLVNYEPSLQSLSEWWKQLFGESEGKDKKGIFPDTANFSTDLHSYGQYIQDGRRNLFETVIHIEKPPKDIIIKKDKENLDGMNYLSGIGSTLFAPTFFFPIQTTFSFKFCT
jgi:glucose-6-phosphate isomerase